MEQEHPRVRNEPKLEQETSGEAQSVSGGGGQRQRGSQAGNEGAAASQHRAVPGEPGVGRLGVELSDMGRERDKGSDLELG